MDRPPLVVAPYDAELYGHWWYEGPMFIEYLFRKMQYDQQTVMPITPSEYLALHPKNQTVTPALSSWGHKGFAEVWLSGENDWVPRHLHRMAERMQSSPAPIRRPRACGGARSSRPPGNCSWPSRATGPSS